MSPEASAIPVQAGEPLPFPRSRSSATVKAGRRTVKLTNLTKTYFPDHGLTKRDLLEYYLQIAPALLPHLKDRAMVMKRYPNGIRGKFFFMKRTPPGAPEWLQRCSIEHASESVIDFPIVQDLAALLWIVNLGCIDLNPWYARCEDVDRPDFLHFDLDPVEPAGFAKVREVALLIHEQLDRLGATSYAKTTGSKGIHVYVPIVHGPVQKQVWTFAKAFAFALARKHPDIVTAEYRIKNRPPGRILVDYNQNAWGRTLASIYSVRPRPGGTASTPVTWEEIQNGVEIGDFTMRNVPERVRELGDLWKPLLWKRGRFDLKAHI